MSADLAEPRSRWLTAAEAIEILGVSRQTLYAYVSRRRLGSIVAPDNPRQSLYDALDIRRLVDRNRQGRSRGAVAASTLSFGEPILASGITRIEAGRLEYRGHDVMALSADATLEQVAALLWQVDAFPRSRASARRGWPLVRVRAGAAERCIQAAAELASVGHWSDRTETVLPDASRILDRIAWAAAGLSGDTVPASDLPLHLRLASAWGAGAKAADIIRCALVLLADHELNASTYAARVVASTRAPLGACVLAGLAALTGPLHGGMSDEVRVLINDKAVMDDPQQAIAARLARGERIPGFGQPLYPDGDPRAKVLLQRVGEKPRWRHLRETIQTMTGQAPNVDYALALMERRLHLPQGAAFAVFAVGRSVGWIAHALEQWREGKLIRPRAIYRAA